MTDESSEMERPYEIASIQRGEAPPGTEGSYWYRYVIAFNGSNTIHGCRRGGLKSVTMAVEEIVVQLNERYVAHWNKPRRVHLVLNKNTHK